MTDYSHKVLITGSDGQVANALRHHPQGHSLQLIALSRRELDITNAKSVAQAIAKHQPSTIINTAAYTAVDKAEQEQDSAFKINHDGAKNLAESCQINNIRLVHLSTDYVFDGNQQTAYTEQDTPNPINVYGQSKLAGEEAIRNACDNHIILRVSGVFSEYGHNFLKTMIKLARERKELSIVSDQITCPTYAKDIAASIFMMIKHPIASGTYHYCSADPVSWHDFAIAIIAEAETHHPVLVEYIKSISSAEYPTAAKRPLHSVLNCEKINAALGVTQPSWIAGIRDSIRHLQHLYYN